MKYLLAISVLITLGMSNMTLAQSEAYKEAEKLLEVMNTKHNISTSMQKMMDLQIRSNPQLKPYKDVMLKFLNKHMSYESLKPEFAKIYSETFTAKELREIIAFYETPTGKKAVKKLPELMAKGAQLGMMRVQKNMHELQAAIKAEKARLDAQKKK